MSITDLLIQILLNITNDFMSDLRYAYLAIVGFYLERSLFKYAKHQIFYKSLIIFLLSRVILVQSSKAPYREVYGVLSS